MNPNRQKVLEISTPKGKIIVMQTSVNRYYIKRFRGGKVFMQSSCEVVGSLDKAQTKALKLARRWLMVREIGVK